MSALSGRSFLAVAAPALLALGLSAAPARADAIHDCVVAANSGQSLRDAGKLTAARRAFLTCSADACPAVVREDCRRWDAELEPRVSSLTFAATASTGEDLADVRVSIDGVVVTRRLDGRAIAVDPGGHDLAFEATGFARWQELVVVREGEKSRVIAVRLARPASGAAPPVQDRSIRLAPLAVSGALTAVGATGFALFGALGKSEHDRLASSCAAGETCSGSAVASVRNKWIVADVSLGIGVIGAGFFTAFLIAPLLRSRPAPKQGTAAPIAFVLPEKSGASLGLRWDY